MSHLSLLGIPKQAIGYTYQTGLVQDIRDTKQVSHGDEHPSELGRGRQRGLTKRAVK